MKKVTLKTDSKNPAIKKYAKAVEKGKQILMKKQTEKDFINWIKKQIDFYKPYLDINLQNIEVKKDDTSEYLCITCTYPYLEPTVYFVDKTFENWKKGKLPKERILHELCHILTDPLYVKAVTRYVSTKEIEDERERLTDKICIILHNIIK